jgi:SAM-dependent methyltransferase
MKLKNWRFRLGKAKSPVWPRMEQNEYRSYRAVHPFDERFGVETSGLIYDLPTGHAHDLCNNGYFAVAPSIFHQVMERLDLYHPRFRFVDVGSGKGRALLLASGYPFREVLGVEISPQLDRIARANIQTYAPARSDVLSIVADAAEFSWPPGPLVVYMWNAFTGPVMERVLRNLEATPPRELYVIYIHPELNAMLERVPWLETLWTVELTMNEEDYSAWAFPGRSEICTVYRSVGFQSS